MKGNVNVDQSYEGFYARFETPSKAVGSLLMGADNIVGNDYTFKFKTENGVSVAWIYNKFDAEMGYLDAEGSRKVQLANARGQKIRMLLSLVAYSDDPDPGMYWGEVAVLCFNPAYAKEMDAFADRVADRLKEGVRPAINLGSSGVSKIFEEEGWVPSDTVPLPKKTTGMAVLKNHQSISEKMIEQGRARNRGCYVVSWLFIAVVVVAVVFLIVNVIPK